MRVVGVHKGLLREMTISAIRPEERIPKVVQRKQIGNLLPRGPMAGCQERTKTGLREITPAKLPPCPQPNGLWCPVLSTSCRARFSTRREQYVLTCTVGPSQFSEGSA